MVSEPKIKDWEGFNFIENPPQKPLFNTHPPDNLDKISPKLIVSIKIYVCDLNAYLNFHCVWVWLNIRFAWNASILSAALSANQVFCAHFPKYWDRAKFLTKLGFSSELLLNMGWSEQFPESHLPFCLPRNWPAACQPIRSSPGSRSSNPCNHRIPRRSPRLPRDSLQ